MLGSSLSIQRQGYLPKLVESLSSLSPDSRVDHDILNASLGGTNVYATLAYAATESFYPVKQFKPSVAIIEKAPNNRINNINAIASDARNLRIQDTIVSLRRLIRLMRSIGCHTVICLTSFIKDSSILDWHGDSFDLSYLAFIDKEACSREGAIHLNAASIIAEKYGNQLDTILLDDVHVNQAGAEVYSEIVYELLSGVSLEGQKVNSLSIGIENSSVDCPYPLIVVSGNHEIKEWSSSMISTRFQEFRSQSAFRLPDDCFNNCWITGIFFIADPESPTIKIESDDDDPFRINLFDHYCYMQRVHFRLTRRLRLKQDFVVSIEQDQVNYEAAINQFKISKTFDPDSDWAQEKYLVPLQNAALANSKSLKLIGFVIDFFGHFGDEN